MQDKKFIYGMYTMIYGAIRKMFIVNDAKLFDPSSNYREYPLLASQKALIIGTGSFASIYLWPYYLFLDVNKLEIYHRSLPYSNYWMMPSKRPTSIIEYFLA